MSLFRSAWVHFAIAALAVYGIAAAQPAKQSTHSSKKQAVSSPVDLNTASESQLEQLPGVGKATAKKIIAARPYNSPADLSKAGVNAKTIQQITPMVTASGGADRSIRNAPSSPSNAAPGAASGSASRSPTPSSSVPASPPAPGMVWVNKETKVFHRAGDRWYGNTKHGQFMTEQDAIKAGYRESREK